MPNKITDDPEQLKEYQDELEYHEETHPIEIKEPSKLKKFLIKANNVSEGIGDKIKKAVKSPTAHKIDGFLRDLAERSNNADSETDFNLGNFGGDFGGGFNYRNEDRTPPEAHGSTITKTIRPNGEIVITTHTQRQHQREKSQRGLNLRGPKLGGSLLGGDDDHL